MLAAPLDNYSIEKCPNTRVKYVQTLGLIISECMIIAEIKEKSL